MRFSEQTEDEEQQDIQERRGEIPRLELSHFGVIKIFNSTTTITTFPSPTITKDDQDDVRFEFGLSSSFPFPPLISSFNQHKIILETRLDQLTTKP